MASHAIHRPASSGLVSRRILLNGQRVPLSLPRAAFFAAFRQMLPPPAGQDGRHDRRAGKDPAARAGRRFYRLIRERWDSPQAPALCMSARIQ